MSYIDHSHGPDGGDHPHLITHSWAEFTARRLRWLYGDGQSVERRAATTADLSAWRQLGSRRAAA